MESDGGGIVAAAAPTTPRRFTSQHSSLRDSFVASDLADAFSAAIVNNNNNLPSPRPSSNLTLGAVLNGENRKSPPPNNIVVRTLLEIIHKDETPVSGPGTQNSRKSWKSFKDRLKIKKSHSQDPNCRGWTSSIPVPQSDVLPTSRLEAGIMANRSSVRNSLRNSSIRRVDPVPDDEMQSREVDSGGSPRSGGSFRLSAALAAEREETRRRLSRELDEDSTNGDEDTEEIDVSAQHENEEGDEVPNNSGSSNEPMRMSLMDLLEETDRQAGISGPTYRLDEEEEEEEEESVAEEEEVVEELGKGEYSCCVCMVRHKGAAFIPCGHTFCRMCSRELFVQRGNCPLCNNFILEILDIF